MDNENEGKSQQARLSITSSFFLIETLCLTTFRPRVSINFPRRNRTFRRKSGGSGQTESLNQEKTRSMNFGGQPIFFEIMQYRTPHNTQTNDIRKPWPPPSPLLQWPSSSFTPTTHPELELFVPLIPCMVLNIFSDRWFYVNSPPSLPAGVPTVTMKYKICNNYPVE